MKRILLCAMLAAAPVPLVIAAAAGSPAGSETAAKPRDADAHLARMQEEVQRMQDEMNRMRQAPDTQARQQVMQDHMSTMHAHMQTMHAMMQGMPGIGQHSGPGMMGGGMMHGAGAQDMTALCMEMMQQRSGTPAKPEKR